jgi:putative ABC transport system substrate-binding protein
MIDRRSFVRLAAAGLVLGSSAARAQKSEPIRKVGVLSIGYPDTPEQQREGMVPMNELGWFEGRNIVIERRFAGQQVELLRPYAEELARLKVDVILVFGTEAAFAAKNATSTIPIVLGGVGDPVGTGLVQSLAHPGGNITGYSMVAPELEAKRCALTHELLPDARRVAVVANPANRVSSSLRKRAEETFRSFGVEAVFIESSSDQQFKAVPAQAAQLRAQALQSAIAASTPSQLAFMQAAMRYRLPTAVADRDMLDMGALMAFDVNLDDEGSRIVKIVDKILRGANPAEMPIEQPTRFMLVLNLKAAKALGVTVPNSLLLRADEVIR